MYTHLEKSFEVFFFFIKKFYESGLGKNLPRKDLVLNMSTSEPPLFLENVLSKLLTHFLSIKIHSKSKTICEFFLTLYEIIFWIKNEWSYTSF